MYVTLCYLQQDSFSALQSTLSHELSQQASANYAEMLRIAKNCFTMASSVTSVEEMEPGGYSEEWLLNYMLGKIAEKLRRPPNEYLEHYQKVVQHPVSLCHPHFCTNIIIFPASSFLQWFDTVVCRKEMYATLLIQKGYLLELMEEENLEKPARLTHVYVKNGH